MAYACADHPYRIGIHRFVGVRLVTLKRPTRAQTARVTLTWMCVSRVLRISRSRGDPCHENREARNFSRIETLSCARDFYFDRNFAEKFFSGDFFSGDGP